MGSSELVRQLGEVPLFTVLDEQERVELARFLVRRVYQPSQMLFLQEQQGDELYLILSGAIAICRESASGRRITLAIRRAGSVVGELAIVDGEMRSASGYAQEETECLVLHRRDFWRFLDSHPEVNRRLLVCLAARLREAAQQVEELAVWTVRQRLAALLVRLALDDPAEVAGERILLQATVDYQMLSGLLCTNRESVSRAATELVRDGLLQKEARRFLIPDLDALNLVALQG